MDWFEKTSLEIRLQNEIEEKMKIEKEIESLNKSALEIQNVVYNLYKPVWRLKEVKKRWKT